MFSSVEIRSTAQAICALQYTPKFDIADARALHSPYSEATHPTRVQCQQTTGWDYSICCAGRT
jgi:hypothetical protein